MSDSIKVLLDDWYETYQDTLLSKFSDLVSINSFTTNYEGVNKVQDYLEDSLNSINFDVDRIQLNNSGDLLIADYGSDIQNRIVLMGHCDTVHPPNSDYKSFEISDGLAKGPGVVDMKSGLCVILGALDFLAEHNLMDGLMIRVMVTPDEERDSLAAKDSIIKAVQNSKYALVFEYGREGSKIITSRGGIAIFDVKFKGRSAHAGNDHAIGINAVVGMADFITQVSSLTDYSKPVTVNAGPVSGGQSVNTVPDFAELVFEVRASGDELSSVSNQCDSISQEVAIKHGLEVEFNRTSFVNSMDPVNNTAELLESYIRAGKSVDCELVEHIDRVAGVSDANVVASQNVAVIDGLGPLGSGAHTDHEQVDLESLRSRIFTLAAWLVSQRVEQ